MIKIHIHEANKTSRFRNLFQPKTPKSNSFSEHFNTKSHNLVVNFFILTIDTPTYLSNQTNLPRPPNKIFFFQTYLSRSRLHTYGADRPKIHLPGQCMVTFFIPFTTTIGMCGNVWECFGVREHVQSCACVLLCLLVYSLIDFLRLFHIFGHCLKYSKLLAHWNK